MYELNGAWNGWCSFCISWYLGLRANYTSARVGPHYHIQNGNAHPPSLYSRPARYYAWDAKVPESLFKVIWIWWRFNLIAGNIMVGWFMCHQSRRSALLTFPTTAVGGKKRTVVQDKFQKNPISSFNNSCSFRSPWKCVYYSTEYWVTQWGNGNLRVRSNHVAVDASGGHWVTAADIIWYFIC